MSVLEYNDFINFDLPYQRIYTCLNKRPLLTMIIGARCLDGVVLVADKKLTNIFGGKPEFKDKLFGDLGHFPMGYAGLEDIEEYKKYTNEKLVEIRRILEENA